MTPREELEALRAQAQRAEQTQAAFRQVQPGTTANDPVESPQQELARLRALKQIEDAKFSTTASGIASNVGGWLKDAGKSGLASAMRIGSNLMPAGAIGAPAAFPMLREARRRGLESAKELDKDTGLPGFIGGTAVDIAGTAGIGAPGAVPRIATAAQQAMPWFQRALPRAAAAGGAQGALTNENPVTGAAVGAVGGGVGQQLINRTAGRASDPFSLNRFEDAQEAFRRGIPLTLGQASNPETVPGRIIRSAEEGFGALPLFGAGIRNQREIAEKAWRNTHANEVAANAAVPTVPPIRPRGVSANDVLEQVGDDIGGRYDALLAGRRIRPTGVLRRDIDRVIDDPTKPITMEQRNALRGIAEANFFDPVQNNAGQVTRNWDMPTLWQHQSSIRQDGQRLLNSQTANSQDRAYGRAQVQMADAIKDMIERRYPATGSALRDLDQPFAELTTLRAAAAKAGPRGEYFPRELGNVARRRGADVLAADAAMMDPLLTKMKSSTRNILGGVAAHTVLAPIAAPLHAAMSFGPTQRAMTGRLQSQQWLARRLQDPDFVRELNRYSTALGSGAASEANQ